MKFFSDLGSCYRPTTTPAAEEVAAELPSRVTAARVGGGGGGRGTRRRSLKSKSESGLHWQPTLSAISESSAASAAPPNGGERRGQGRQVLKKLPVKGKTLIKSPSFSSRHDDYCRESSMVMAMPAFSPTPFLF